MKNGKFNKAFRFIRKAHKKTLNYWKSQSIELFHNQGNLKTRVADLEAMINALSRDKESLLAERGRMTTGLYNRLIVENPKWSYTGRSTIHSYNLTPLTLHISLSIAPEEVKMNPSIAKWQGQHTGKQVEYAMLKLIENPKDFQYDMELQSDGTFRKTH